MLTNVTPYDAKRTAVAVRASRRLGRGSSSATSRSLDPVRLWHSTRVSEDHFGENVAATYDEMHADSFDPAVVDPAVDLLAELAGDGRALELGIGTGRLALPLAQRSVPVHGIELSDAMVARLRAKPGAELIEVTIGDFATTTVEGNFSLAYLVFNTIANLTTQDEQVACFENVARHLEPGGSFVIELGCPWVERLTPRQDVLLQAGKGWFVFEVYDRASQSLLEHVYELREDGRFEVSTVPFRYVWPSELDLMARLAGLTLHERWGGWRREPFTSGSTQHVSVWVKPAELG